MTLFDASAWVGMWPFTATRQTDLAGLVRQLAALGVTGALVSPLNAVLGPDPMLANDDLLAEIEGFPRDDFVVRAAPVLDPSLPGWDRDLARLVGHPAVTAIRIVPNYHGYDVAGQSALALADAASHAGKPVVVQVRVLDERAHHPLMKVPAVPVADVARLATAVPGATFVMAGAFQAELALVAGQANVLAEVSSVESTDALGNAIEALGVDRLLLGTHAPVYEPAVAVAKLLYGGASEAIQRRIGWENASFLHHAQLRTN